MAGTSMLRGASRVLVILAALLMVPTVAFASVHTDPRPPAPRHATLVSADAVGLNVPWGAGGPRLVAGELTLASPEWPATPVRSVRLWDSRTAWLNLEPARGMFVFTQLDRLLDEADAHGVEHVTLTVWGTPRWAAADPAQAGPAWMGPGSGSVPADMSEWARFVSTLAAHARGRVDAYEIGNEPNDPMFFSGTPEQYWQMQAAAIDAIRATDPDAQVVLAGPVATSPSNAAALVRRWVDPPLAARADAVSVHAYPVVGERRRAPELLTHLQRATASWADRPVWLTELNLLGGATLGPRQQGRATTRLLDAAVMAGYERVHWYAWSRQAPGDLLPTSDGTPSGTAFERVLDPSPAA